MNEDTNQEKSPSLDRKTFLAEIERLYIEGYRTRQIAQLLGEDGNKVGRNLREIKRRWACAARRQRAVLSQTQCAAVYREAMSGWQRSQESKLTTTEHRDANGDAVKTTTRRQDGPGDKAFLLAAVSALKTLRQFAAEQAGESVAKDGKPTDVHYMALLEILTPEQVDGLDANQIRDFRAAFNRMKATFEDARRLAEGRHDATAKGTVPFLPTHDPQAGAPGAPQKSGQSPADEAGLPGEPAPQDPGEDPRPNDGVAEPAADAQKVLAELPQASTRSTGLSRNSHEAPPDAGDTHLPSTTTMRAWCPAQCPGGTTSADVQTAQPLETEPASEETRRSSSILTDLTGACAAEPARAGSGDPGPMVAAPPPAVSAPDLGAAPYPAIPMLNGKPPTPEVHLAYQQWQNHLWQSLMLRPLYGSAMQQQSPQTPPVAAARDGA